MMGTGDVHQPEMLGAHYAQAAAKLRDVASRVPWNTDYAIRAAKGR